MTWTRVGGTSVNGANGGTASTFDSRGTGGRKKVGYVTLSYYTLGPTATFTDSKNNTWTQVNTTLIQAVCTVKVFRCIGISTDAAHTITTSGTGIFHAGFFDVFETDVTGSLAVDGTPTHNSEANTNLTVKPGAITPSQANSLLYTGACLGGHGSIALSVLTKAQSIDYSGGTTVGGGTGWLNAPASSNDPQWSWATNDLDGDSLGEHQAIMDCIKDGVALPWAVTDIPAGTIVPMDMP